MTLLDELGCGVPFVEAPSLAREHGFGHATTAIVLLVAPQLVGIWAEARLLLAAERGDIRRWIAASEAVLAAALLVVALTPSAWPLAVAFAIAAPASGVACDLAQGSYVEANADRRERAMAHVTLAGALGDLAAPAFVAIAAALGAGWRAATAAVAVLYVVHAFAILRGPPLRFGDADDEDESGPRAGLRDALGNRTLMLWLAATTTCSLLDETFVILSASWLRESLGAGESAAALAVLAWAAGWSVGLIFLDRVLERVEPRRVLIAGACLCVVVCLGWLAAPSVPWAAAGLFAVGLTSCPLYPIAKAQAFAACPGRPALVGAADSLFTPVELALIAASGLIAEAFGPRVALASMIVQPLVILALAVFAWPKLGSRRLGS